MTLLTNEGNGGNQQQNQQQQNSGGSGGTSGGSQGGSSQGSGSGSSWRDSLPEEIRNEGALSVFSDVGSLAKSYLSTKALVGKKGVIVPGEKATDEEWGAFFKSIGQPEADKFDVKIPEGVQANQDFVTKFKEMAHKSGLLPKQAQGLLDWYAKHEMETLTSRKAQSQATQKQGLEALQKEWGAAYEKEIAKARLAVKELGGEELQQHLEKTGLGNDPVMIRLMAKAGSLLGEDKLRGEGAGRMGAQTPAEIQKSIEAIMGNKSHPYWDRNHPGHKSAIAEMEQLWKSKIG